MRTRRPPTAVLIAIIGLAVLLVLVMAGFFVRSLFDSEDPADRVNVIDDQSPTVSRPAEIARRLNASPGEWGASMYDSAALPAALSSEVRLDLSDDDKTRAVITNLKNPDSVRRNGAFLMLWTGYVPTAELISRSDAPVLTSHDQGRKTYRLGTWVAYYTPPAMGADRTSEVEAYLKVVAKCPFDAKPCAAAKAG